MQLVQGQEETGFQGQSAEMPFQETGSKKLREVVPIEQGNPHLQPWGAWSPAGEQGSACLQRDRGAGWGPSWAGRGPGPGRFIAALPQLLAKATRASGTEVIVSCLCTYASEWLDLMVGHGFITSTFGTWSRTPLGQVQITL